MLYFLTSLGFIGVIVIAILAWLVSGWMDDNSIHIGRKVRNVSRKIDISLAESDRKEAVRRYQRIKATCEKHSGFKALSDNALKSCLVQYDRASEELLELTREESESIQDFESRVAELKEKFDSANN